MRLTMLGLAVGLLISTAVSTQMIEASPAFECDPAIVKLNGAIIHGSVECGGRDYMDTPTGYAVLAHVRQCKAAGAMADAELVRLGKEGMANFDELTTRDGLKATCKLLEDLTGVAR